MSLSKVATARRLSQCLALILYDDQVWVRQQHTMFYIEMWMQVACHPMHAILRLQKQNSLTVITAMDKLNHNV